MSLRTNFTFNRWREKVARRWRANGATWPSEISFVGPTGAAWLTSQRNFTIGNVILRRKDSWFSQAKFATRPRPKLFSSVSKKFSRETSTRKNCTTSRRQIRASRVTTFWLFWTRLQTPTKTSFGRGRPSEWPWSRFTLSDLRNRFYSLEKPVVEKPRFVKHWPESWAEPWSPSTVTWTPKAQIFSAASGQIDPSVKATKHFSIGSMDLLFRFYLIPTVYYCKSQCHCHLINKL